MENHIQVFNSTIVVTLQSSFSAGMLPGLQEGLLQSLHSTGLTQVVIDLGGIELLDDLELEGLINIKVMVRLMGAEVIFAGFRPQVVLALDNLGVDLKGIRAARDVDHAISLMGVN